MNTEQNLSLSNDEDPSGLGGRGILQAQELWLILSKMDWTTLVILPARPDGSTNDLASELADAGSHLCDEPVTAVTASTLEAGSARALAALAQQVSGRQKRLRKAGYGPDDVIDVVAEPRGREDEASLPSVGRLILSVPSVAVQPVSVAVANAADLVVLGVELEKTSFRDIRRSIELVGRERIAGCVLL